MTTLWRHAESAISDASLGRGLAHAWIQIVRHDASSAQLAVVVDRSRLPAAKPGPDQEGVEDDTHAADDRPHGLPGHERPADEADP